jgi:NAD(P)H-hydrate repair Nnr-like enzyme with NAD(P)H-hydrate dehydratase domain
MQTHPYWQQQSPDKPLYPDIEWSKPERRDLAGRLGVIGGNKLGFAGVAEAYSTALTAGVGEVRVLLPDVLKKSIPPVITDTVFAPTTPSGSLASSALPDMTALGGWASGILLVGDAGRNSETAIAYERFLEAYEGPLTITRDAVDLIKNNPSRLVERPETMLVISFAQLQKLFSSVYYPKVLTFSMQLTMLIEAVHKFTTTYPTTLLVLHKDHIIAAYNGSVTSTPWENPMAIWRGQTAAKAASYWLWNRDTPLEAITASISTGDSS